MEKLLRSPPFLFNLFSSFGSFKSNWGRGKMWRRRGRIPCAKAGSFVRAEEPWEAPASPALCGVGFGAVEKIPEPSAPKKILGAAALNCPQKILGAAALSCSPSILRCNFNLLFFGERGECYFCGSPPSQIPFFMGFSVWDESVPGRIERLKYKIQSGSA